MRKGIVFSLTSMFLFIAILIAVISVNNRILNEKRLISQEIPAAIDRVWFETISRDIGLLFNTTITRTITNTSFYDELPYAIDLKISDYESFLYNVVPNLANSNITITNKERALYLSNHTRVQYGPNKESINFMSNKTINNYVISMNLSGSDTSIQEDWAWTINGVYVVLELYDSTGSPNPISVNGATSGFVNPNVLNNFNISFNDGSVLRVWLSDYLLVNTTNEANRSIALDITGQPYTGYVLKVINPVMELNKEYKSILR